MKITDVCLKLTASQLGLMQMNEKYKLKHKTQ